MNAIRNLMTRRNTVVENNPLKNRVIFNALHARYESLIKTGNFNDPDCMAEIEILRDEIENLSWSLK